ncbi:MAG: hypothetical protein WBA97_33640 [Actinophytocola sp.]|uniref:hypothetical protein n=1 Tax=Actinophytocola sp. TaxID=1872138 RepID=UPI003C74DCBA
MRVDIAELTPSSPSTAVAHLSAETLVSAVLDARLEWWRRKLCALALVGRIPAGSVPALFGVVRDSRVGTEVRAALLEVLPPSEELLTWLRTTDDDAYNLDLAILRTRARLKDSTSVPDVVALMADEGPHRRLVADQCVDLLGHHEVLAALGFDSSLSLMLFGETPAARLLGVRLSDLDVTQALADEERMVAREAYDRLAEVRDHHGELLRMVADQAPGHLWALAVLAARGEPIGEQWAALGEPMVPVPGLPADVRAAIVRQYVPGTRDTDPRWLLEAACLPAEEPPDVMSQAMAALAPVNPAPPVPVGDHYQQGEGTYHLIDTDAGQVEVSTLGRFYWTADGPDLPGFRRIDEVTGAIMITGLPVYFFGRREPLSVRELLFYWQD